MVYVFKVYLKDYYDDACSFMGYVKTNGDFKEAWAIALDVLKEVLPSILALEMHSYQTYEPKSTPVLEDALDKFFQEDYI